MEIKDVRHLNMLNRAGYLELECKYLKLQNKLVEMLLQTTSSYDMAYELELMNLVHKMRTIFQQMSEIVTRNYNETNLFFSVLILRQDNK